MSPHVGEAQDQLTSVELLLDGKIKCITMLEFSRKAIDTFMGKLETVVAGHPFGPHLYLLLDLSRCNLAVTPYVIKSVQALSARVPDHPGGTALILPDTILTKTIQILTRAQTLFKPGSAQQQQHRFFFSKDEGLGWLMELIEDEA